ncbi:MAG: hypothetical protein WC210_01745 [Candidatus Neomarinimicrobiota bacterium]
MLHCIQKHANTKNIIILLLLFLLFQQVLFRHLLPQGEQSIMVDTQLFYTAEQAAGIINNYTDETRRGFITGALTLDLVFPWIYTLLLGFLFVRYFKNSAIALSPFLIMIFDYLENAGIVTMLAAFPRQFPALIKLTAFFSGIKWTLLFIITALLLFGIFRKIWSYFHRNNYGLHQ